MCINACTNILVLYDFVFYCGFKAVFVLQLIYRKKINYNFIKLHLYYPYHQNRTEIEKSLFLRNNYKI